MDLQYILSEYGSQLKNMVRTLENVASVCQKILATLYDTYSPAAEARRPGLLVNVQTATFLQSRGFWNS